MLACGWTVEQVKNWDRLGSDGHTHHVNRVTSGRWTHCHTSTDVYEEDEEVALQRAAGANRGRRGSGVRSLEQELHRGTSFARQGARLLEGAIRFWSRANSVGRSSSEKLPKFGRCESWCWKERLGDGSTSYCLMRRMVLWSTRPPTCTTRSTRH